MTAHPAQSDPAAQATLYLNSTSSMNALMINLRWGARHKVTPFTSEVSIGKNRQPHLPLHARCSARAEGSVHHGRLAQQNAYDRLQLPEGYASLSRCIKVTVFDAHAILYIWPGSFRSPDYRLCSKELAPKCQITGTTLTCSSWKCYTESDGVHILYYTR